jgi:hypothetical protein
MVRTASRRGGTPSKTKKPKTHRPKPKTPRVKMPAKSNAPAKTIPADPQLATEALERIALAERELQTVEE